MPGYAFLVGYLGEILQMPGWLQCFSPFSIVPTVPAEHLAWTPLVGLALLAGVLIAVGVLGFRRRSVGAT